MDKDQCSVIFATPSTGSVAIEYKSSIERTVMALVCENIKFGFIDAVGNPYIDLARNRLATAFLDQCKDAQNLFFIDDDLGWPASKVIDFLNYPEDIVAGVYRLKQDNLQFPCNFILGDDGNPIRNGNLIKALVAPGGFMRIRRNALEKIANSSRIFTESGPNISLNYPQYEIFNAGIGADNIWRTEDVNFVRKAAELGIDVWIDPDINFSHRGIHAWHGNLLASMNG